MKSLFNLFFACFCLCAGCSAHVYETSEGDEGAKDDQSENDGSIQEQGAEGGGGEGGGCVALPLPKRPYQTCENTCDCAQGLKCLPCVNTVDKNCLEYCLPGDPMCNYGVATCPVAPGLVCESVRLCQ